MWIVLAFWAAPKLRYTLVRNAAFWAVNTLVQDSGQCTAVKAIWAVCWAVLSIELGSVFGSAGQCVERGKWAEQQLTRLDTAQAFRYLCLLAEPPSSHTG